MLEYVGSTTKCRSVLLLDYFGEESERCGKCDTCRERNELEMSTYEFDLILDRLKSLISGGEMTMEDLVSAVEYPSEKVVKVIRWLLDHNKIITAGDNTLAWKGK
jgi:ATP-dependent DNA helicase RecQ